MVYLLFFLFIPNGILHKLLFSPLIFCKIYSFAKFSQDLTKDKARSIKEGKYKKEAFRGAIFNNDYISFEIPDSWNWMFVSDMSLFQEGPGILAVDFRITGVPLIRIAGMQTDVVSLEGCNYLDENMVTSKWSHFRLDLGDIVISTSASMDKIAEVNEECVGSIPYTGLIRFKMYGGINKNYFKWFIKSPCYMKQVNEQKAGGTIKHYGPSHLKKMVIPIPPLAEQKRIVARIEELLTYIDRYEQAWSKLEDFNKRFPGDMQKSILQLAIQGKLVEQHPEEGTAEELYQHIQAEKQRLIEAGTIKKEKSLPEIAEDEKPFDIPENWKWVRLKDLTENIGDGIHGTPDFDPTTILLTATISKVEKLSSNMIRKELGLTSMRNIGNL